MASIEGDQVVTSVVTVLIEWDQIDRNLTRVRNQNTCKIDVF